MGYYIEIAEPDGGVTVRHVDLDTAARRDIWTLSHDIDQTHVSTMFSPIPLDLPTKDAYFYETMVFGGPCNEESAKYRTRAEAIEGHARMVQKVKKAQGVK
jgi:hypothetical protein